MKIWEAQFLGSALFRHSKAGYTWEIWEQGFVLFFFFGMMNDRADRGEIDL